MGAEISLHEEMEKLTARMTVRIAVIVVSLHTALFVFLKLT